MKRPEPEPQLPEPGADVVDLGDGPELVTSAALDHTGLRINEREVWARPAPPAPVALAPTAPAEA